MTIADITLTGNTTVLLQESVPITDGRPLLLRVRQDATGSRTMSFITPARFSDDLPPPTLSTIANSLDYLLFRFNTADAKYDLLSINRGFV